MKTDWIVFDGSNAAHRLSAVNPALTTSKGERTEVMYGLLRLVSSVVRQNPAKRCVLVWDGKGSRGIRTAKDPTYKAHRHTSDDEETKERLKAMYEQLDKFWSLFGQYLPIEWLISESYEADDIMAMLAHEAVKDCKSCLLVSGDKDLLQLVTEGVSTYSPNSNKYCTLDNFQAYTGGYPDGFAFLAGKCLMGDSSDNIKGVGGVGEKTALKILSEHGWDLHQLKESPSADLKRSKVYQTIISPSGWDRIRLNYSLMSLHGPIHQTLKASKVDQRKGRMDTKMLRLNLAKMQFVSIMASFTQFISPFNGLE
jgi:DNA polymerase-1